MLNRIILMGRLTRDPELRRTQTGTPVASFSLAVDRDFKDRNTGERTTDFIDCVAWRSTTAMRHLVKYLLPHSAVEARLQIRDWTDKDGGKRRSAEVVADNVYFGDSKRDGGDNSGYNPGYAPAPASHSAAPSNFSASGSDFAEIGEDDGELPF